MQGMSKADWAEGKSTRSGLLWEVERLLRELPREQLPDILLMENVPQVHSEQNKDDFDIWVGFLRSKGYVNHWKDLNARDYGIPQNRERCFMVSILSDEFIEYEFPKPIKLETVMKDYLEESVDEKYYINSEKANKLIEKLVENGTLKDNKRCVDLSVKNPKEIEVANCICARTDRGISNIQSEGSGVVEFVGNIQRDVPQGYSGSVYKTSGISPCCLARDYKEPILILEKI